MSKLALYVCALLYVIAALGEMVSNPMRVVFICYAIANLALGFAV